MTNEQKKSNNSNRNYIIIAALVLCAVISCTLRSCCGNDVGAEIYQRTDAAMDAIEREHAVTGRELDTVGAELDSAGTTVGRIDELVDRSQECVIRNTESVIECQQIVGECRKSLQIANEYTVKLRKQIEQEREAAAKERERAYWKGWLNGFCVGLVTTGIAVITK